MGLPGGLLTSFLKGKAAPAPEFVSASSARVANANNMSVTAPAGIEPGDMLVAYCMATNGASTFSGPSGWTQDRSDNTIMSCALFHKVADGSEGATLGFFSSNSTGNKATLVVVYRGGIGSIVTAGLIGSAGTSTVATAPSISPASAGTLLAFLGTVNATATITATPAGMIETYFHSSSSPKIVAYELTPNSAGATGDKTTTWSNSANTCGVLVQIK